MSILISPATLVPEKNWNLLEWSMHICIIIMSLLTKYLKLYIFFVQPCDRQGQSVVLLSSTMWRRVLGRPFKVVPFYTIVQVYVYNDTLIILFYLINTLQFSMLIYIYILCVVTSIGLKLLSNSYWILCLCMYRHIGQVMRLDVVENEFRNKRRYCRSVFILYAHRTVRILP